MTTIKQWLDQAIHQLKTSGVPSARLDSLLILEDTLGRPREWVLAHDDDIIDDELGLLNQKLEQRNKRTPIAYIVGTKEFYGRDFKVNKHTLIPRPESEAMIHELIEISKTYSFLEEVTIVDIGTGSGALAVTAKLALPGTAVIATDISKVALDIAQQNAAHHSAQIQLYSADLLDFPAAVHPAIVMANLPYVPDNLITSEEIKAEPKLALFSGSDGLGHYKRFWQQLINLKHKPSYVITESLKQQHNELIQLAMKAGYAHYSSNHLTQCFRKID